VLVDRTSWGRLKVTGADRVRFLQGLTTVNVEKLADGAHGWGAILTPKGRVVSVVDIASLCDHLVVACEPSIADKTRAVLERYAVMDDVAFEPIAGAAYTEWTDLGSVWAAPIVDGGGAAVVADTDATAERLRIRAGFPRYGDDIDEDHFPFETPLAALLDYTKGCYVGQEPVFRVHAQGNAARALRGLAIEGGEPVAAGAPIAHPGKDNAGAVTSSVIAADAGSILALGYLHRTCWTPGDGVTVAGRRAIIHELPWD
jgi:folate-binding protein YgfZ